MQHKVFVESIPDSKNAWEFFRDMDFSIPINYDLSSPENYRSFHKDVFLPVHIARLVHTSKLGACGYKCFGGILSNAIKC